MSFEEWLAAEGQADVEAYAELGPEEYELLKSVYEAGQKNAEKK